MSDGADRDDSTRTPSPATSTSDTSSLETPPSETAADDGSTAGRRLRGVLSRTGRIARWEVARGTGTLDRKTVLVLVAMLVVVAIGGFAIADEGLGLEDGIYAIGIDEDDPYYDAAVESDQFRVVALDEVEIESEDEATVDVVVSGNRIGYVGPNGPPASEAFRDAVAAYNENLMGQEDDEAAAYPVLVEINYQERDLEQVIASSRTDDGSTAEMDGATDGTTTSADGNEGTGSGSDGSTGDESESDADATTEPGDDRDGTDGEGDADEDALQVPNVGGGAGDAGAELGSPGSLAPPFPFQSLVLAFLFIVPMNFVIQTYGSTIMDERIKRRGELLLVSPASRYEIVAGKTLPYLLGLVAVVVAITVAIGGGPLSVAAAIPIALLFLAATFVGAMLARSFKELTFVTVTISVCLTTYAFIPAIFTDVTPIALISPLTLIVMDLQGDSVAFGEYLFSTAPFYCSAAVLFLLGIGVYREEDMFDQKAIPAKLIDAIASQIDAISHWLSPAWSPFVLSILFIPFVFAAQLLTVALLFAVPEAIALPVVFVLAAAIEEFAKSIHVYAGFARSRFASSLRVGVLLGALSGLGFFLGEKLTHVVQFVGLPELTVGVAAFGPELASAGGPLTLLAIVLAPLVLHVVTAIVSAVGASRGPTAYAVAFVLATLVHAVYNLGVIALVA